MHGLISDPPMLLQQADLAVLRAGPQSISESLVAGIPVIAFDWHVHEHGNMQMLLEHKCGWGSKDPKQIVHKIEVLYREPELLNQWKEATVNLAVSAPRDNFAETLLGDYYNEFF